VYLQICFKIAAGIFAVLSFAEPVSCEQASSLSPQGKSTSYARPGVASKRPRLMAAMARPRIANETLLNCITPGINGDAPIKITKPFRKVFFPSNKDDRYTGEAQPGEVSSVWLRSAGQPRIAVMATYKALEANDELGGEVNVLALFEVRAGKPRLIDAVDVSCDRFVNFASPSLLEYKTGTEALIIDNNHFNSSQNCSLLLPVALINNRLVELCHDVPSIYNARTAGAFIEQKGSYAVGKQTTGGLRQLTFVVKVIFTKSDEDDSSKVTERRCRTFHIMLHPNGQTYSANPQDTSMKEWRHYLKVCGFGELL
jgi:hypothetical protein